MMQEQNIDSAKQLLESSKGLLDLAETMTAQSKAASGERRQALEGPPATSPTNFKRLAEDAERIANRKKKR